MARSPPQGSGQIYLLKGIACSLLIEVMANPRAAQTHLVNSRNCHDALWQQRWLWSISSNRWSDQEALLLLAMEPRTASICTKRVVLLSPPRRVLAQILGLTIFASPRRSIWVAQKRDLYNSGQLGRDRLEEYPPLLVSGSALRISIQSTRDTGIVTILIARGLSYSAGQC
jgi:hypothetical protein